MKYLHTHGLLWIKDIIESLLFWIQPHLDIKFSFVYGAGPQMSWITIGQSFCELHPLPTGHRDCMSGGPRNMFV